MRNSFKLHSSNTSALRKLFGMLFSKPTKGVLHVTPLAPPLVERGIVDIVEAEVVQSHLLEAILRRHQRLHFFRLARPRSLSLLLTRVHDAQ